MLSQLFHLQLCARFSATSCAAGEGNKSPTLCFDTVYSGELAVSANADGTYCMELPAYTLSEEVPIGAAADSALVQVLLDTGYGVCRASTSLHQVSWSCPRQAQTHVNRSLHAISGLTLAQVLVGDTGLVESFLYCQVRDEVAATCAWSPA